MLNQTGQLRIATFLGFVAVVLGAMGAHGHVHDVIAANDHLDAWQKAVFYQFIHTVMLYVLAHSGQRKGPYVCFLLGILLFSGSLYFWSWTNLPWLPHVTPVGGVAFIVGWLWLTLKPKW